MGCQSVCVTGPDALVSGSRFDWTVTDPWRELCKFPKDLGKNTMSSSEEPWLVGLYWDCTTQLYRDYNRPVKAYALTNQYRMECQKGLITAHMSQ